MAEEKLLTDKQWRAMHGWEEQRLLGKPVDGVPASPEDQLIALDTITQEILDSWAEDTENENE